MQRLILTFVAIGVAACQLFGQAPEGINYQAVARDGGGHLFTNQSIDVRFTIRTTTVNGTSVYEETHNPSTNDFGLFTLMIGQGTVAQGDFTTINWGTAAHFLQVEIDAGNGYVDLGTTQLMSVPYALYAKEAANAGPDYSAGSGIDITGTTITNTGDTDGNDDITETTAAGGDLTGTYPDPQVIAIRGNPVAANVPAIDEVLKWDGSKWAPGADKFGNGGSSLWHAQGNDLYYDDGMVGIGTQNPESELDVVGKVRISKDGHAFDFGVNEYGNLEILPNGDSVASISVDDEKDYIGLFGHGPITVNSHFDVNSDATGTSYGGMFVNTEGFQGKPFYGYATGKGARAWSYFDGTTNQFRINNKGDRLVISDNGRIGIGTNDMGYAQNKIYYNSPTHVPNAVEIESGAEAKHERLLALTLHKDSNEDFFWATRGSGVFASIKNDGTGYFRQLQLQNETDEPKPGHLYGNALPIAMGQIESDGNIISTTNYGITSVTKTGTGTYDVVLHNSWRNHPIVNITCYDANGGEVANYNYDNSINNKIIVKITNHGGTLVDSHFSILVYGPANHW